MADAGIADHLKEDKGEYGIGNPLVEPIDAYSDVKIATTLSIEYTTELDDCQKEYCDMLTNVPGRSSVLNHRVITKSDIQVHYN